MTRATPPKQAADAPLVCTNGHSNRSLGDLRRFERNLLVGQPLTSATKYKPLSLAAVRWLS